MKNNEFLNEINHISNQYKIEEKEKSDNYNLFTLLNRETDEVLTHSAIIVDLLDPKGKHGLGNIPLKLFLEMINITNFELDDVQCYKELPIGKINDNSTEGGRVDIYIKNNQDQEILIENKIYASELKNQLLRYYNFAPKSTIIYLTLEGEKSKKNNYSFDYVCISYKQDIINWIEHCIILSSDRPKLKESLSQYNYLLKKLTNQITNHVMAEKITKIITNNFVASTEIYKNYEKAYNSLYYDFLNELKIYFTNNFNEYYIEIQNYKSIKSLNIKHKLNNYSINIRIKDKSLIAINILDIQNINNSLKSNLISNGFKGLNGQKVKPWKIISDFDVNNLATVDTRKELLSLFNKLIIQTINSLK